MPATLLWGAQARVVHVERAINVESPWVGLGLTESHSLRELVRLLSKSATGKNLLTKAKAKALKEGRTLEDVVLAGDKSLTDTTLIRKFSPDSPERVDYQIRSRVLINRRLNVRNAILDMAHELTHYVFRDGFNPYLAEFDLKGFITSTVEGKGGEVEAYLVECKVSTELFSQRGNSCGSVIDGKSGAFSKFQGVRQFYRVGSYHADFVRKAGKHRLEKGELPHLSSRPALFISSAYGMPYPLAALHEYENIMRKVCQNDSRRLQLLKGRGPAYERFSRRHRRRCRFVGIDE